MQNKRNTARRSKKEKNNTKFYLASLASIIIIAVVWIVFAFTGTGHNMTVEIMRDISLRETPNIASSVIEVIPQGTMISIDKSYQSDEWTKISTGEGIVGYIFKSSAMLSGEDLPDRPKRDDSTTRFSTQKSGTSNEFDSSSSISSRSESANETSEVTIIDREDNQPATNSVSIFDDEYANLSITKKIQLLETFFPDGKYWNHMNIDISGMDQDLSCMIVTDKPCEHEYNGYEYCNEYDGDTMYEYDYDYNIQCLGFASMVSDFLFGKDAGIETFYDFDDLCVGDHVRFLSYEHSMIVTEKYDDYIVVLECNADYENCEIQWGREITADEIYYYYDYEFLRRVSY